MNQMKSVTYVAWLVMAMVLLGGCINPLRRDPIAGSKRAESLTSGYSLLKHIAGQEKGVGMVTWVKNYEGPVEELLMEIGEESKKLSEWLDDISKGMARNGVRMNAAGLPEIEVWSRDWIEKRTRKAILGGQHERSELVMVLAQAKALEYMAALCEGIANLELSDERRNILKGYSKRFQELHEKSLGLLRVRGKEKKEVENFGFERKPQSEGFDERP